MAKNDGFPYNNFSAGGVIALGDEVKQGGLARAVAADNADTFATFKMVGQVFEQEVAIKTDSTSRFLFRHQKVVEGDG